MKEDRINEAKSQPSEPRPCSNNCGFWGRPETMNMCSKCYKGFIIAERQVHAAMAALSLSPISSQSNAPSAPLSSSAEPLKAKKVVNRCESCNKKVGLLGFKCKCGMTFCGTHRYPEMHECKFDYKNDARESLAKANPPVKADKLEKL